MTANSKNNRQSRLSLAIALLLALASPISIAQECTTVRAKSGVGTIVCTSEEPPVTPVSMQNQTPSQKEIITTTASVALQSDRESTQRISALEKQLALMRQELQQRPAPLPTPPTRQAIAVAKPLSPPVRPESAVVSNAQPVPASPKPLPMKVPAIVVAVKQPQAAVSAPATSVKIPAIVIVSKPVEVRKPTPKPAAAPEPTLPKPTSDRATMVIPKYNYTSSNLNEVGVVSVASVVNSVVLKLVDTKSIPVVINVATKKPMPYRVVKDNVVIDDFADQPVFVVSLKGKSAVVRLNASMNKDLTAAPSSAAVSSPKNAHFPVVFGRGSNIVKLSSFTRPNLLALKAAASNAKSVTVHTSGDESFTALMQTSQRNYRAKNIQRFLIRFCGIKKEQIAIEQSTIKQSTIIFNY